MTYSNRQFIITYEFYFTVMASVADIRTYVYGATYDSWNRVRTMTYPDGEVVTYHYNATGLVESLTSSKQGKEIGCPVRCSEKQRLISPVELLI